jgi:hypothetical protein
MNTITISPLNNNISISGTITNGTVAVSALSSTPSVITVTEGKQGIQGIQGPSGVSVSVSNYGSNRLLVSNNTSSGVLGLSNISANESGIYISGIIVSISGHQHITTDISGVTASSTEINYLSGSIPGSGTSNNALVTDLQGNIVITGHLGFNNGPLAYPYPRIYNNTEYLYIGNHIDVAVAINSYDGDATFAKNSFVINASGGLICTSGNLNHSVSSDSGLFNYLSVDNIRIDGNTITSTNSNGNLIIQTTGTGAIQRDSGGNSRGQYAVDLQNARNSGTQVAAANYSNILGGSGNQIISDSTYSIINGGSDNTISANGSFNFIGGGDSNTISNYNSGDNNVICGGYGNTIEGEYYGNAVIGGGYGNIISVSNNDQTIPEVATIPGGYEAKATRWGELSHAAGRFSNAGDAQHTILIARKLTTNNTANVILLLDNGVSGSYKLELPNKTTWTFEIKLSAYNDTDSAGGGWIFKGAIRSDGSGNTAIIGVGVTAESWLDTAMSGASADVVANDTTNSLDIRVTGLSGKNIRWVAVIDISQVCYGTP